jgi:hypothetical protein
VILSAAIMSCGPSQKPPPAPVKPPPPPAAPKGDTFRLSQRAGAAGQGKVSIRIENEPLGAPAKPSRKGAPAKLVRAYVLTEEHSITGVEPDGTQHVVGKLLDVEAKTDNPKEQKDADALARALSEVKISFDRAARGEISNLDIKDVNKPLDPVTARIVAGSIYGAGRGQIFAADPVEVGQEWTIHSEVPIPAGGNNVLDLSYHYDKKDGSVATCSFTGKSAGESQGAQLTGEMKGSFEFDLMKGAFVRILADTKSARDPGAQATTPGSVLRVHVEWEATTPPGAAPSASR